MLFYEPHARDRTLLPHDPFKALVAPRPIGWISTRGPGGEINLAPYSFFNAVCDAPPMVAFSSSGPKDSATFAEQTGEFTWNLPTWDLREHMNLSSDALPRGTSEFDHAGLEMAAGELVRSPRVAASPCSLECRVVHTTVLHDVDGQPSGHHLVVGQVVGVHLDEEVVQPDGRVDLTVFRPIARCGYLSDYAAISELFQMPRPGMPR
jgi:flavin reductase (DIM6/NTAB) family NADH-FMN oxidoreductase RutF